MIGIYKITNKINGKFYIGQSINIKSRIADHFSLCRSSKNYPISRAIAKYGKENFDVDILAICQISELNKKERYYIKKFKPDYNVSSGGVGNRGHKVSAETKKVLSIKSKLNWLKKTDEEKLKVIINLNCNRWELLPEKEKQRLKLKRLFKSLDKLFTPYKGLIREKPVLQLDIENKKIIKKFHSVKSAATFVNIHDSGITSVLKGKQKTAGGYGWMYALIK